MAVSKARSAPTSTQRPLSLHAPSTCDQRDMQGSHVLPGGLLMQAGILPRLHSQTTQGFSTSDAGGLVWRHHSKTGVLCACCATLSAAAASAFLSTGAAPEPRAPAGPAALRCAVLEVISR